MGSHGAPRAELRRPCWRGQARSSVTAWCPAHRAVEVLKGPVKVRPIYLHDEGRIRALVFVSILALMVYSLIEILARRSGMGRVTTRRLLFVFQKISVIELKVKGGVKFRLVEDLTAAQGEILDRLKLKMPASYIKTLVQ